MIFLKLNFFGQRLFPKYYYRQSVINITVFQISYCLVGLIDGLLFSLCIKEPILLISVSVLGVFISWKYFAPLIDKRINDDEWSIEYEKHSKTNRIFFFILMMSFFCISFLGMIYSMKLLAMLC